MKIELSWQPEFRPGTPPVDEAEQVLAFPYEDHPEDLWPEYVSDEGEKLAFPREFRHMGFLCPRPTSNGFGGIQSLSSAIRVLEDDEEASLVFHYARELARDFAFNLVEKIAWRDPDTGEVYHADMSGENRKSLADYLSYIPFLWSGVLEIFNGADGSVDGYEYNDDEGFLEAVGACFAARATGLEVEDKGGKAKLYSPAELGAEIGRFSELAAERDLFSYEREELDALVLACDRFRSAVGGITPGQFEWMEMWKICSSQRYDWDPVAGPLIHSEVWKNLEMLRDDETPGERREAFFKVLEIDDLWRASVAEPE